MDKDITQVLAGVGAGKAVQALMRKYVDVPVAQALLYTAEQYVKDLITAGYVPPSDGKTDAERGEIVKQASGYEFASVDTTKITGANLRGTNKRTADPFTYQAAAGQKVAPYLFPSTMLSGVLGIAGITEGIYNYTGSDFTRENKLGVTAFGASLLGDGVVRGLGVDGTITAPSGFDVSKQPAMQYLDQSAMKNLELLAAHNERLQQEITQLRATQAQPPRGIPHGISSYTSAQIPHLPTINVTEIVPGKGAEALKERTHLMSPGMFRATIDGVKKSTGLVTLSGGR